MAKLKIRPSTLLVAFIALTSVTAAQTFQYSRGWVNGKRDGQRRSSVDLREITNNLEKSLSPCQLSKIKYLIDGKPFNEKLFLPCDFNDDDEAQSKRPLKSDKNQDQFLEALF